MNFKDDVVDRNGVPVEVGTYVRVLSIPDWIFHQLPKDDGERLKTFVGQTFKVYEIDKWGGVWIEAWFNGKDGIRFNHSLSLDSSEMEVIEQI